MVVNSISQEILSGACGLLKSAVPELSPTRLVAALREYEPEAQAGSKSAVPPRMLSKKDASDVLSVSPFTVQRMIEAGQLPARKIRGQWRIPYAALDQLQTFTDHTGGDNYVG